MKLLKLLTVLLSFSLMLTSTIGVSADLLETSSYTTYEIEELNLEITRTVDSNGIVYVECKDSTTGKLQASLIMINGNLYMDKQLIGTVTIQEQIPTNNMLPNYGILATTWGGWSSWAVLLSVPTGGMTAAILAGIVSAAAPWVVARVPAAVWSIIASSCDTLSVETRIRYGSDGTYSLYERQYIIYGDGETMAGPYTEKGKAPLNGGIIK